MTNELCLGAITADYKAIGAIKNPSIELMMAAVTINPDAINYIKKLNESKYGFLLLINYKIAQRVDNMQFKRISKEFMEHCCGFLDGKISTI